ncbi:hypothetical protein HS088_TW04G01401 [Tripterygium wilfordii]|uniref:CASP-like protein n=1 Tax=Tripterygium wilfordii TaxID=458696 RepID=A0A7J7DSR5_TRIWF|nr:CASP-like protein 2C1 [Tripterygium wilfordii]KAF5749432.1 hypothetical protein HS088_TW04G01401 [Tripterygium wilfordii]
MEVKMTKIEPFLRVCAILVLALTACLDGLDSQSKTLFYMERKVTFTSLNSLSALVYVASAAAVYNMLQVVRWSLLGFHKSNSKGSHIYLAWLCYLLDQLGVYIVFGATSAAMVHSAMVISGVKKFQWMKWCNKFTRFCFQIGGALACGYTACALMLLISFISAFNLFRLYLPQKFLLLKH